MNQIQPGRPHCSLVLIIVLLASALPVGAEEPSSPEALSLKLYFDGVVDVDYSLAVDPSLPLANVSLFGWTYGTLIVRDGEGLILEYAVHPGHLVVYTLGSDLVEIDYSTSDLTNKQGSLWSLSLLAPLSVNIQLPRDATVISLSPSPLRIWTVDDRTSLTMPLGEVSLSYLQGVVGTKDHALAVQKEAEDAVEDFRDEGFEVEGAEEALESAFMVLDGAVTLMQTLNEDLTSEKTAGFLANSEWRLERLEEEILSLIDPLSFEPEDFDALLKALEDAHLKNRELKDLLEGGDLSAVLSGFEGLQECSDDIFDILGEGDTDTAKYMKKAYKVWARISHHEEKGDPEGVDPTPNDPEPETGEDPKGRGSNAKPDKGNNGKKPQEPAGSSQGGDSPSSNGSGDKGKGNGKSNGGLKLGHSNISQETE